MIYFKKILPYNSVMCLILFFSLSIFYSLFFIKLGAQTIQFSYDASGNRVLRKYIPLRISRDSTKNDSSLTHNNSTHNNSSQNNTNPLSGDTVSTLEAMKTQNLNEESNTELNKENENNDFTISVFPNPTENYLNINVKGKLPKSQIKYRFYDPRGRKYFHSVIGNHTNTLNMNNFSKGIYFLIFESGGFRQKEKIVIE